MSFLTKRSSISVHNSVSSYANANNTQINRVKKFFGAKLNNFKTNEFNLENSNKVQSPTTLSLNFLKRQDPFYKKFATTGESEILEVQFFFFMIIFLVCIIYIEKTSQRKTFI